MSRSSITLSIATWMRSARSGSSLIATMPRWLRGMRPKWIVSGSPSERPSATFIGSTSPIRSATLVSGVASFSAYRSSRCRHSTGRSSPSSAARRFDSWVIGSKGCSPSSAPAITGVHSSSRPTMRAQQPGLALAALAEQHHVVAGDQGPLELRDDGVLEAVQTWPRVTALAQGGEQVVADLGAQGLGHVARRAELADGRERRELRSLAHATHGSNNWTASPVATGVTRDAGVPSTHDHPRLPVRLG